MPRHADTTGILLLPLLLLHQGQLGPIHRCYLEHCVHLPFQGQVLIPYLSLWLGSRDDRPLAEELLKIVEGAAHTAHRTVR